MVGDNPLHHRNLLTAFREKEKVMMPLEANIWIGVALTMSPGLGMLGGFALAWFGVAAGPVPSVGSP